MPAKRVPKRVRTTKVSVSLPNRIDAFVRAHAERMDMTFSAALADLLRPAFLRDAEAEGEDDVPCKKGVA